MININNFFKRTFILLSFFLLLGKSVYAAPSEVDFKLSLDGNNLTLENPLLVENDRTLVPLRLIAENLGYEVNWNEEARTVDVVDINGKIVFTVDSNVISVNGENKDIDVSARIFNDRTYIPIRALENLKTFVDWEDATRTVIVKKNFSTDPKINENENPEISEKKKSNDRGSFEYWDYYNNYSNDIIMDSPTIKVFNDEILSNNEKMANLYNIGDQIDGSFLLSELNRVGEFKITRYNSKKVPHSNDFKNKLLDNMNIPSDPNFSVRHGIINNRTMMRTYPSHEPFYKNKSSNLDYGVETAIYPWEEIAIYNVSKDGKWYFGQIFNAYGWVPVETVSFANKDDIYKYTRSDEFLVVTIDKFNIAGLQLDMGVRLPLVSESDTSYRIYLPEATENLTVKEVDIAKNLVNKGYLPFTEANMIKQALKFNGEVYGWGGLKNTRDCSGLIQDVYRSMGVLIPRNSGEQGMSPTGKTLSLKGMDKEKRFEALKSFGLGSSIQMEGHVMMYMGVDEKNTPSVIHHYIGHYQNGKYIAANKAAITSLNIQGSNGNSYIMNSYGLKFFKY